MSQNPNSSIVQYLKSKSAFRKTILSFFVFAAAIILLELVASVYNSKPDWFVEIGEGHNPQVVFNKQALKSRFYSFETEPHSFSESFYTHNDEDVRRVFIIGDASISGWPYSENQSLSTKIESILINFDLVGEVELIPVSFAGLNSSYAVELVEEIQNYEPDLIILFLGHNEFYTHGDLIFRVGRFTPNLFDVFNEFLVYTGFKKKIRYDNNLDDFESILPGLFAEQAITRNDPNYEATIESFKNNLTQIVNTLEKENVKYILPVSTDNLLIPPLGIIQHTNKSKADIIFSNARMAIYRDGDIEKAKELFTKTKELDAVKLRIPDDIKTVYEQIDLQKSSCLVRIDSVFEANCENNIPSSKLFLDYIHPNNNGLNLIASSIAKRIIKNLDKEIEVATFDSISSFANRKLIITHKDSLISRVRIQNVTEILSDEKI